MATAPEHVTIPSRDGLPLSALLLAPARAVTVTSSTGGHLHGMRASGVVGGRL